MYFQYFHTAISRTHDHPSIKFQGFCVGKSFYQNMFYRIITKQNTKMSNVNEHVNEHFKVSQNILNTSFYIENDKLSNSEMFQVLIQLV